MIHELGIACIWAGVEIDEIFVRSCPCLVVVGEVLIMISIINQIIELDKRAEEKIAEAHEISIRLLAEAKEEEIKIEERTKERIARRISKTEKMEKEYLDEQIAIIEQKKQRDIDLLSEKFNASKSKWEREIIDNIIGVGSNA